eukprot:TRINITY_DN2483_c0_g2_i1.p1 TRINITY_DN2483_c0_g2~~TRINITY_DN2483_c0_g2_i1.p1  ORF type:complete len:153 (-),score=43.12 TRINITY_DN2483_c0_g2_i1:217-675(-)
MEEDYRFGIHVIRPIVTIYNKMVQYYMVAKMYDQSLELLEEIKKGKFICGGKSLGISETPDHVLFPDRLTYQMELELMTELRNTEKILESLEKVEWLPLPSISTKIVLLFDQLGRLDEILSKLRFDPRMEHVVLDGGWDKEWNESERWRWWW